MINRQTVSRGGSKVPLAVTAMVWDFGGELTIELLDHFLSDIRKADAKLHNAIEVSQKAI